MLPEDNHILPNIIALSLLILLVGAKTPEFKPGSICFAIPPQFHKPDLNGGVPWVFYIKGSAVKLLQKLDSVRICGQLSNHVGTGEAIHTRAAQPWERFMDNDVHINGAFDRSQADDGFYPGMTKASLARSVIRTNLKKRINKPQNDSCSQNDFPAKPGRFIRAGLGAFHWSGLAISTART